MYFTDAFFVMNISYYFLHIHLQQIQIFVVDQNPLLNIRSQYRCQSAQLMLLSFTVPRTFKIWRKCFKSNLKKLMRPQFYIMYDEPVLKNIKQSISTLCRFGVTSQSFVLTTAKKFHQNPFIRFLRWNILTERHIAPIMRCTSHKHANSITG